MNKIISFHLALILLLSSITPFSTTAIASEVKTKSPVSTCENGECVGGLITKLEELSKVYQQQCLPADIQASKIEDYHLKNGLSEECWKLITEINHRELELRKHQNRLEAKLSCDSGECRTPDSPLANLNTKIDKLTKEENKLSCSEPKKKEIKEKCSGDMTCVLASSALSIGGYLAERLLPEKAKLKDCHLGDDSCLTQLATGFLKAAFTFFEGAWDLLKLAGNKIGEKMTDFWSWVSSAEDHSSTSQLAMAKASEEAGFFDMLVSDFPGTMTKVWSALVASIKDWMKNDIFCQKWEGVPHFGKCLRPTESFDCIGCKTMVTGMCSITGTLVSEIVPAFLTGGLFTAAKYGVSGASKIAKLFKVSDSGLKAIKDSQVAKMAVESSQKLDNVLHLSQGLKATKALVEGALKTISQYLVKPTRKVVSTSMTAVTSLSKKRELAMVVSASGKALTFSGKTLVKTGKVLIYPIENPLTVFAFKAGSRSFDKVLSLGAPKLGTAGVVTNTLLEKNPEVEKILVEIEKVRMAKEPSPEKLLALEEELLAKISSDRSKISAEALDEKNPSFEETIKYLYPELQYGSLAKKLAPEKVLAAERELFIEISNISDTAKKEALLKKYHLHVVQGEARSKVVGNSPSYKEILDNSNLSPEDRLKTALKVIKRETTPSEQEKLAEALEKAHLHASQNGVFEYSWSELREKYRILVDGGFSKAEADELIRYGLAGRPPVRELVEPGATLFSGFAKDILDGKYLEKREELTELIKEEFPSRKPGLFGRLVRNEVPDDKASRLNDNIDALYFIDYQHSVPELDNFLSGQRRVTDSALSEKYERKAFINFKDARDYLLEEKPPLNKQTFLEVHKKMMKNGVEQVPPDQLGKIRKDHWMGNVSPRFPIDETVKKEIQNNPYLFWEEHGKTPDGKFYGHINYPNVDTVKKEGLDLIREKHPKLVLEIEEYQQLPKTIEERKAKLRADRGFLNSPEGRAEIDAIKVLEEKHTDLVKTKTQVTGRLVDAMVDELMEWFTRERSLIGKINSPEKLDKFVDLVAKFQRDLVAIHPLANGNGRTTREFALSYALMREGFPPPRILNTESDIYKSLDEWKLIIKLGILASDFLVDDLIERLEFGLPIENSMELLTPYTRPPVKMALKDGKKPQTMDGVEYIDPRLYREIVKREMAKNPDLKLQLSSDPVKVWDTINEEAQKVFAKNNIYYKHPKNGIERVQLNYVDDDFKHLYGDATYDDYDLYNFKMKTWYSEDVTWRGLASKHKETSEKEIVEMFKTLSSHNASNAVLRKIGHNASPEDIKAAAFEDFKKYNDDVFGDGLVAMAKDHSESGPMYGISYGYSTSKNREVGKAFAMGAMVVGEYGAHKAPELQALLKSRVLVGARRANKDVDLGRLKQVREEFSYKYGRQQEVMGIGASDPDAITIVQTIDEKGEVILTYLRNKIKPDQVWVIKGDIGPDDKPKIGQVVKTISLNQ